MPLDHFSDEQRTFKNRYWINATYYKAGGPVFSACLHHLPKLVSHASERERACVI
jgi:hypothetical protein